MTLVIPPTYYHVAWQLRNADTGREAICTAGFKYAGGNVASDYGALGEAFGELMPSVQDAWNYGSFVVSVHEGTVHVGFDGTQGGGTSHTPALDNTCFILDKLSPRPGRMGRGRMFLPGVSEQDVNGNGQVAESKLTELQQNLNDMNAKLSAGHWVWQILHDDGSKGNTDPTAVSDLRWNGYCGLQGRRLRRGRQ